MRWGSSNSFCCHPFFRGTTTVGASIAMGVLASSCVGMPEAPLPVEDLSALVARYDHPTAVLTAEDVQRFIDEGQKSADLADLVGRLSFVHDSISDVSVAVRDQTAGEEFDIEGNVAASVPCPGDGPQRSMDAATNGSVRLQIRLEGSHILRGLAGALEQCRLRVQTRLGSSQQVMVSGEIVVDLGGDISVGAPTPARLLVKLTGVAGSSSGASGTIDFTTSSFDFRVVENNALEILVDAARLDLPELGTAVLVIGADGSLRLRESRGEWTCSGGGQSCTLGP